MWSKKYDKCIKCGNTDSRHASKGICQRCYQRDFVNKNKEKFRSPQKKHKKEKFNQQFTEYSNTLKKLNLIVIHRLYRDKKISFINKAERAKTFIRRKVCHNCRRAYINKWNNDFESAKIILCKDCQNNIFNALDKIIERQKDKRFVRIILDNQAKQKAIQFELEWRLNKPIKEILKEWHLTNKMSSYQIAEKLQKEFFIYIGPRSIMRWLDKFDMLRPHIKALRVRIDTGRMDFSKRRIDYNKRKIDYDLIVKRKKSKVEPEHRVKLIRCPDDVRREVISVAQKSHRTVSEVVREMLEMTKEIEFPASTPIWAKLKYAIDKFLPQLLRKKTKLKRGQWIILAKLITPKDRVKTKKWISKEDLEELEFTHQLEQEKEQLIQKYIVEGRRWLVNIKDKIGQRDLDIKVVAKSIGIDPNRLKLFINQEIMVKPKDQKRIADYFKVNPEEIFSNNKIG